MNMTGPAPTNAQAHDLISGLLDERPQRLTTELSLGDIPGWDSVTMVRLVVSLEEILGRQLDDAELENIETVGDVEALMKAPRLP